MLTCKEAKMEDKKKDLNCEDLNAVTGGEGSEYTVTKEKRCPYCNSIYVRQGKLRKRVGTSTVWILYRCLKCNRNFWVEV